MDWFKRQRWRQSKRSSLRCFVRQFADSRQNAYHFCKRYIFSNSTFFYLVTSQVSSVMTALSGLTSEHNVQVAQMKSCHPDVRFPSLFCEIFELPKMSTSTPERKKPELQSKSPVLDVSRDSLISSSVEPVSSPGASSHIPSLIPPMYDANDFNMFMSSVPKDTSDYSTSPNSSDIDSGTNRLEAFEPVKILTFI